ncbi:MAG: hypothetical protein ACRCTZ_12395 [Sarcina sp.]
MRRKALKRNNNLKNKRKVRRRVELMRMINKKIEFNECNTDK